MQITKISYSKTVESNVMGAGVWIKIGVDADINESDSLQHSIGILHDLVDDSIEKYLPKPQTGDLYFNVTKNKEERG